MVDCPHCAQSSTNTEFCDHCYRELAAPARGLPHFVRLGDGSRVDCSFWRGAWPADCWQPISVTVGEQPYRLYALGPNWWADLAPTVRQRAHSALAVLAPIEIIPIGSGAIVAARGLPGGKPLPPPPARGDELEQLASLLEACRALATALRPLHQAGFVWLNFQPERLERSEGQVRLTNLDLRLFPAGERCEGVPLSGTYSPPEVHQSRTEEIGPATDVFHVAAYAYYRLAGLLPRGFPGQGLSAFDFAFPPLRIYLPNLPIGVAPVLERGLASSPGQRYPSVDAFVQALDEAGRGARERRARAAVPLNVDVGGRSVTGRAKAALGRANQDAFVVTSSPAGPFILVADGVTRARIGTGDLASQTACTMLLALPARLSVTASDADVHDVLRRGCLEASRAVVQRAVALGPLPHGTVPSDLMSTTALVGVLRAGTLSLANVGDGRAYLLTGAGIEQLTVDGDVACTRLALGSAPEEVRALGDEAQELYFCLGVSEPAPFGGLRCSIERSAPQVTHWQLSPGDVVVFCTDGLVEEGAFLSPREVAEAVRANPELSASALAEALVALADGRQRLPSPREPEGFGDNITCVVLKASAGSPPLAARPSSA